MTVKTDLTTDWVQIATGPSYHELTEGVGLLYFGEDVPDQNSPYIKLGAGKATYFDYSGTKKVWARTSGIGGTLITVENT